MSSPRSHRTLKQSQSSFVEDPDESLARKTWLAAETHFSVNTDVPIPIPAPTKPSAPISASFVTSAQDEGNETLRPTSLIYDYSVPSSPVRRRTPHISSLQRPGPWSRLVSDTWAIELVAASVSCAAIASIVGILCVYDQHPLPSMTKGTTPNTVIAFLATISRTAIMICISTVLSQGKWLWFRKERSLVEFQNIESASRGPLGSLGMIFKFTGGVVPYVAALLMIATLGFDPFLQQLLTTRNLVVPEQAAGIAINSAENMTTAIYRAMDYSETHVQLSAAMLANLQQQDNPMQIMAASFTEQQDIRRLADPSTEALISPLKAMCSSGRCVWQPYHTLDICTKCRSTTDEIEVKNLTPGNNMLPVTVPNVTSRSLPLQGELTTNFTWQVTPKIGQGWQMHSNLTMLVDGSGAVPQMKAVASMVHRAVWPLNFASSDGVFLNTSGWSDQSFASIDGPVAAIGFADFSLSNEGLPALSNAFECALTYCVNEYNRSVDQGGLISDVLSTNYGKISGDPNAQNGLSWSAMVNGTNFTVDSSLMYGTGIGTLAGYLLGQSIHTYTGTWNISRQSGITLDVTDNSESYNALYPYSWRGIDLGTDFEAILSNMNDIGSQIVQQYGNVSITGSNAVTKTFLFVRWGWIALPIAIVIFGLVAFAWTMLETYRQQAPIWKASLLPLVYRYVPPDDNDIHRNTALFTHEKKEGRVIDSDKVSRFEVEAVATKSSFAKSNSAFRVWQLQSIDVVHEERIKWYRRFKW